MANNFNIAHKFTAKWEGGESDHPDDGGGLTKYGVSLKFLGGLSGTQSNRDVLERMGIRLPITRQVIYDLTRDQAASLFRWQFWDKLRLGLIPLRPAVVLYDAAVNSGPAQSVKLAQRGYNRCVAYGQPLVVDGIMGPDTRAAMQRADTDKCLSAMLDAREAFFQTIVANNPSQQVFLRGWINRVDDLRRYVRGL
ncbi:glycoside hydrolase family 108 protein [Desulfovibrio falkowii]|uniref:glycoside hydrolase family 108 protein n=1 Tax=Desulfovibrio sp. WGS1351 TaxID=3366814 RepID=UPI00372D4F79